MNITTLPVRRSWDDEKSHRSQMSDAINNILKGKINNIGTVTLTANAASTIVTDPRCGAESFIGLMPSTANAATAIATTYISSRGNGTFTLTHANNAQTDKTFTYSVLG